MMLSRIEVGSKAHVLLWLADQPAEEHYHWLSAECPCGQYGDKFDTGHVETPELLELNALAQQFPHTWGALYERARKAWQQGVAEE